MRNDELSPILNSGRNDHRNCNGNMNAAIEVSTSLDSADEKRNLVHDYWLSILCVIFGIGTWLPVNAVYSQMPIFILTAPEGWSLPSYFSILVQMANISPLLCYVFQKKLDRYQSSLISCFLIIGSVSILGLAFTHHIVSIVFNVKHSVYFFIFSFFISLVGCTSSVLFLPFMNKLPELYLIPYFIGEGISGLVPSLIALAQGIAEETTCRNETFSNGTTILVSETKEPLFSSTIFLVIMTFFMCLSTVSFQYLKHVSTIMKNKVTVKKIEQLKTYQSQSLSAATVENVPLLSRNTVIILLFLQMYINFFSNGMLPSIQSYSCLPYGTFAYHWSVNLNQIIGPTIVYFAFFLPVVSIPIMTICCVLQLLCLSYELVTAFTSPTPPLIGTSVGVALIIIVWVMGSGLISYIKLSIAAVFRRRYQNGLVNYGLFTQIGSSLGSVITFVLINNFKLLHSVPKDSCD